MIKYCIGVDGGGTKTHAVLAKNGIIIAESYSSAANIRLDLDLAIQSITSVIDELCIKFDLAKDNVAIGIGVAGFSVIEQREKLISYLNKRYQTVRLTSDCHIACLAANKAQDGGIIICGTGIVGYVIDANVGTQIGGWGFPHGDLGGGAWLGLEICKLLCKAIDGVILWSQLLQETYTRFDQDYATYKSWLLKAQPSDFATIATLLLKYQKSDTNAQKIIQSGINEVLKFIDALITRFPKCAPKLAGGLAKIYLPYLSEKFPNLSITDSPPAIGGCYLFNYGFVR